MSRHFVFSKWRLKFPIFVAPWLLLVPAERCWDWGVVLAVLGIALRIWAAGHIGKGKDLVTTGPYGYLRHPLYLGTFLIMIGLSLVTRRPETIILLTACFLAFYAYKIHLEESRLEQRFGEKFQAYREAVPGFLPSYLSYPMQQGKGFCWANVFVRREYHSVIILLSVFSMIHVNESLWDYLIR
jgi:protein-S-isoprenylcysteine O-methyltransferase Ste14